MTHRRITLIERKLWVWECPQCADRTEVTQNPPKERLCSRCRVWAPFKEVSYTGPDLEKK